MDRVYLRTDSCGPLGSFRGGREYAVPGEMPAELAEQLVAGGYGRAVDAPPTTEVAVVAAPENTAVRTEAPKPRGRGKARA